MTQTPKTGSFQVRGVKVTFPEICVVCEKLPSGEYTVEQPYFE